MPMSPDDWAWFAASVLGAAAEIRAEDRLKMAVEVKGLAETVRQAKQAISKASQVAMRVNDSATELVQTMRDVEQMTSELDRANAELKGALGTITNGGPPLDDGGSSSTASAGLNIDQAANVVAANNAG